jgi:ABC-type uncharacterized transport system substrate-binding protein
MKRFRSKFLSDNRKPVLSYAEGSAIQNPKWLGVSVIAFVLVVVGGVAKAQQPTKAFRIGYLVAAEPASESMRAQAIGRGLRELGYIEGQNIVTEYRYAEGKVDRLSDLAAELVRLKVDVIVVAGADLVVRAAKNATKTIPIVMTGAGLDPVETGLVDSLARPGGNVTGITNIGGELLGKRLELLKEAIAKVNRVAVLYDATRPDSVHDVKAVLPAAARALRFTIEPFGVGATEEFDKTFAAISKWRPDGLYVPRRSPIMRANEKRIVGFALKTRIPSLFDRRDAVEIGGLMSYGADLADTFRLIAWYVDKVLKGTKPADLPVQQPTKFELVFNLRTAKRIGVTIPQSVLARADRVIK